MTSPSPAQILRDLIAVPSVNPAHSRDPSICGELRMAETLARLLAERGFSVEILDNYQPERPSVIAHAGPADGPSLMFEVHLDTVGVDHMSIDPFQARIEEGRLYGRGACDMKGATAALLHALSPERVRAIAARGIRLLVVGAPDEECGTLGATTLAAQGIRADRALILEPTRCRPVIAHKGAYWYEVILHGRAGHGSQPQSGVSTNEALARLLPEILRAHKALQDMFIHPVLGCSSLNFGRIEGGHTYNIIPDRTLLQLDRRVVPNEAPELFENALRHILQELMRDGKLLSADCRLSSRTPAFATPADSSLVRQLQDAIHGVTGERPAPEGTSWVSDASPFAQVCGETLVFGPGDIAQAHTANEYITLEQLDQAAAIFARFLDNLVA